MGQPTISSSKLLIFVIFITSTLVYDAENTRFKWGWVGGQSTCYEVDKETGGSKFSMIASPNECSDVKPKTKFEWGWLGGQSTCYELDKETGGSNFSMIASASECSDYDPNSVVKKLGEHYNSTPSIYDSRLQKVIDWSNSLFKSSSPKRSNMTEK